MTLLLLVFFSFFPLAVWSFLAVRFHGVSIARLLFSVFAGLAAIAFASVFQVLLNPVAAMFFSLSGGVFFSAFIESSLVEELSKLFCIRFIVVSPAADRLSNGPRPPNAREILSCAVTLALSFSAFETIAYTIRSPGMLWIRMLTAMPVHVSTALASAFLVAASRISTQSALRSKGWVFFIVAVALHGAYNACLVLAGFFPAVLLVVLLVCFAVYLWKKSEIL